MGAWITIAVHSNNLGAGRGLKCLIIHLVQEACAESTFGFMPYTQAHGLLNELSQAGTDV